jgi:phytoene synthase
MSAALQAEAGGPGLSPERAAEHARAVVEASGTSFRHGMRILSKPRRDAMYAIYAFCREIDDIADGDETSERKFAALAQWRSEIDALYAGTPSKPTAIALLAPIRDYDLPKDEFLLLIEGMEMDAAGPIQAPTLEDLIRYCRRVAGAVGMLSMPVFGAPRGEASDRFALSLGEALQLTNILRDVAEDAEIDRLYLPSEMLEAHGIGTTVPKDVVKHPALPGLCAELGKRARRRFAEARAGAQVLDWRVLRPALLMMGVYERYLERLEQAHFDPFASVSIGKFEKIAIALRYGLAPPRAR